MDLPSFQSLLSALQFAPSQQERLEAETAYFKLIDYPDIIAELCVQSVELCNEQSHMAAILLRNNVEKDIKNAFLYNQSEGEQKSDELIVRLLHVLAQNQDHVLALVAAGHIARCVHEKRSFPAGRDFLLAGCQNENPKVRKVALQILKELLAISIDRLAHVVDLDFGSILMKGVEDKETRNTSVAAVALLLRNSGGFIEPDQQRAMRMVCVQKFIELLNTDLKQADKCIESIELLYYEAKPDSDELMSFLQLTEQILGADMERDFKAKVVETVTSVCINCQESDIQTVLNFDSKIISNFMATEQSLEDWTQDVECLYKPSNLFDSCTACIDLHVHKFGQEFFKGLIAQTRDAPLNALCIIHQTIESVSDILEQPEVVQIVHFCIENYQNTNPIVRHKALHAIAELFYRAEYLYFDHELMSAVMATVIQGFNDTVQKVQLQALFSLINILTYFQDKSILVYKNELLQIAEKSFSMQSYSGKGSSLAIISILCEVFPRQSMEPLLNQIVPQILQSLSEIITQVETKQELRKEQEDYAGRVIECISFAIASCPHLFSDISKNILSAIISMAQKAAEYQFDNIISQSLSALKKISKYFSFESQCGELISFIKYVYDMKIVEEWNETQEVYSHTFNEQAKNYKMQLLNALPDIFSQQKLRLVSIFNDLCTFINEMYAFDEPAVYAKLKAQIYLFDIAFHTEPQIYEDYIVILIDEIRQLLDETSPRQMDFTLQYLQSIPLDLAHLLTRYLQCYKGTHSEFIQQSIHDLVSILKQFQDNSYPMFQIECARAQHGGGETAKNEMSTAARRLQAFWDQSSSFYDAFVCELQDEGVELMLQALGENEIWQAIQDQDSLYERKRIDKNKYILCVEALQSMILHCTDAVVEQAVNPLMGQIITQFLQFNEEDAFIRSFGQLILSYSVRYGPQLFQSQELQQLLIQIVDDLDEDSSEMNKYMRNICRTALGLISNVPIEQQQIEFLYISELEFFSNIFMRFNQSLMAKVCVPVIFGDRFVWFTRNMNEHFMGELIGFVQQYGGEAGENFQYLVQTRVV